MVNGVSSNVLLQQREGKRRTQPMAMFSVQEKAGKPAKKLRFENQGCVTAQHVSEYRYSSERPDRMGADSTEMLLIFIYPWI
jgi:hypothetical protein